jgi:hypothetical protein
MRPYPEELLRIIQTAVGAHLAPEVASAYGKAQFAFSMLLFGIAQQRYDTAVPDLLEANEALRGLLAQAAEALARVDGAAAAEGRAAIASLPPAETSLALSALRKENDALRGVLSSLAPLIEPAGDDESRAPLREVRTAVYAHLQADARRRVVPILG